MNYNGDVEGGGGSTEWFVAGINQQGGGIGGPVVGPGPFPLRTGYAMAVGDLNADGSADVIVGSPYVDAASGS